MTEQINSARLVVAVDGPSGSGKSSVCQRIAHILDAVYLDTGAMYRAAAAWCLQQGIDLENADPQHVTDTIRTMPLQQSLVPGREYIQLDGTDVTAWIRTPEVSAVVSVISTNLDVRKMLIDRQRQVITDNPRIVAEGRDITTVVAPDAHARILLTASEEVRMSRRGLQLDQAGSTLTQKQLAEQVTGRDQKDATVVDFLSPAHGVALVDSSDLDLDQTVDAVLAQIRHQAGESRTNIRSTP